MYYLWEGKQEKGNLRKSILSLSLTEKKDGPVRKDRTI